MFYKNMLILGVPSNTKHFDAQEIRMKSNAMNEWVLVLLSFRDISVELFSYSKAL